MSEGRARLFVALELPEEVRRRLAVWRDGVVTGLPGLRSVAVGSLHVTLCFLGWVDVREVDAVAAACEVVAGMPASPLQVTRGIWLPARQPRVLAVELLDLRERLGAVQSALTDALMAGGWYTPEKRRFLPHVTVARVGRGARLGRRAELPPFADDMSFDGITVTLFRSRLSQAGARYEGLGSVSLETSKTL